MESNPKELRLEIDKIDRISELPDPILSIILCNLPTKNAVGTSILSTRWKNLFPFGLMPKRLDFDDLLLLNPRVNNNSNDSPCVSFIDFVDWLLNEALSGVHSVEEIILKCDKKYGEEKLVSWVSAALRLNVRHLDLKFSHYESTAWCHCLNACTTLVTLRLWLESHLHLPDHFSLPNLKELDLVKLILDDWDDPINQLIEGCPALECLYLYQCDLEYPYDMCIQCPLLKKLIIEGRGEEAIFQLTLDAPNLEVLIYKGVWAFLYDVCHFNSLHTAHVDIGPNQQLLDLEESDDEVLSYLNSTAMIVSRCSSTIRLYLSECAIDALHHSSVQLPVFRNLLWLSLNCLHWSILARLLQIAPNLEQLTIKEGFQEDEGGFQNFVYQLPIPPECLVLRVKRIEFWVFGADEDEIKLVEYFLRNGEVLKNLILHCLTPDAMSILTRLNMLPRKSKACQIDCRMK